MAALEFLRPGPALPPGVRAAVTTRTGGVSRAPFESLNLAAHAGDEAGAVAENRRRVREALSLPTEPAWLEQVHGNAVVLLPGGQGARADAAVTFSRGHVCAVLVADCLPVFLASRAGDCVGIAHAGWRGLSAGVIEATIAALDRDPGELVAWLGPSIGPDAFEVGTEVRDAFIVQDDAAGADFRPGRPGHWMADLPGLARRRLAAAGVGEVAASNLCTLSGPARFFSYRRDGVTGRMAALAWLD